MGAATPEQAFELLDAAFVAMDVEAIAGLYEEDAVFANPPYWTAIGRAAIVEDVTKMFGATNAIEVVYDPLDKWVVADDYAFIHLQKPGSNHADVWLTEREADTNDDRCAPGC